MGRVKGFLIVFFYCTFNFFGQDKYVDSLNYLYKKTNADTQKINLLKSIASYLHESGKYAEAIKQYQKISNTFYEKYPEHCLDAHNQVAFNYIYLEDYTKAKIFLGEVLNQCNKRNYLKGIGFANRNYAFMYVYMGDYKQATAYYLKALEVWEKTGNNRWISMGYSDLGLNFYYQENFEKAAYYWENCIKVNPTKNSDDHISNCTNLGMAYLEINNFNKAEVYFKKAVDFFSNKKESLPYTNALSGLANLEFKQKKYDKALTYYNEVINIREKNNGHKTDLALTYLNVSVIYGELNKPKDALEYGLKGYEKAKNAGDIKELMHAYNNLNVAYARTGNYEKAYEFSQLYNGLRDSLSNIESLKQINELDKKYQTEKKEKDNQLLSKQLEIQQIQGKQQKTFLFIGAIILLLICILTMVLFKQNKQKQKTNFQLSEKNKIIEEQHKDITDSIKYAQRIQQAILPPEKFWHDLLPNSFVLYKPKDILSGDFYWIEQNNENIYVAAADCTGHGVPGALMSIVNYNLLNKAVLEQNFTEPSKILDIVNKWLTISLHQTYNESAVRDGMDVALCSLNKRNNQLQFAGAFNGGFIFKKDGNFIELTGDKKPVGAFIEEKISLFTNHILSLEKGDKIFIFSDGYADQFGGPKGKKLKYKKLQQFITESLHLEMQHQKNYLEEKFNEWKGNIEQVDDVLIIGITV